MAVVCFQKLEVVISRPCIEIAGRNLVCSFVSNTSELHEKVYSFFSHHIDTLDPLYNAVIGRRPLYRIITKTVLY